MAQDCWSCSKGKYNPRKWKQIKNKYLRITFEINVLEIIEKKKIAMDSTSGTEKNPKREKIFRRAEVNWENEVKKDVETYDQIEIYWLKDKL